LPQDERENCKAAQGNFLDDAYVHCLDCGDGFTGIYTCQILSNCTLGNVCSLSYINMTSIKAVKQKERKRAPDWIKITTTRRTMAINSTSKHDATSSRDFTT
jgi:hypothetical protein